MPRFSGEAVQTEEQETSKPRFGGQSVSDTFKPTRVLSEEEKGILEGIRQTQEQGKGIGSGIAQMFTGAAELLPQEYGGRKAAEATKYLKTVGDPASQTLGQIGASMLPFSAAESLAAKGLTGLRGALKIPETSRLFGAAETVSPSIVGGAAAGYAEPTGITNEERRTEQKRKQAAIGGATGGAVATAAEVLPAVASTVKTAISPEKTIAEKITTKAATPSDVGDKIEKNVIKQLDDSLARRKSEAEKLFNDFYSRVEPYQDAMRNEYAARLYEYAAKREGSLSGEQINLIKDSLRRMENPAKQVSGSEAFANAKGLDLERRRLSDIADKPPEGFVGATINTARDLEKIMQEVLNSPKGSNFDNVLKQYAKLSEPINLAEIAFGQKVTKKAGDYIADLPKYGRDELANAAFKNRDSVEAFRRLTGNNEQFVQDIARDKIAFDLKGASSAKEVRDVINKNIDWLNTPQMGLTVYKELLDLEKSLRTGQRLGVGAALGAGALGVSGILGTVNKMLGK